MKEYDCVEVKHHKDVGKTIAEYQKDGWHLHTYQTAGTEPEPSVYDKPAIEYAQREIPSLASYFSGFDDLNRQTEVYIDEARYTLTNAPYASPILEEKIRLTFPQIRQ